MKKILLILVVLALGVYLYAFIGAQHKQATTPIPETPTVVDVATTTSASTISILPEKILPGDPVFITIDSVATTTSILYDEKPLSVFSYKGNVHAFLGIDFAAKASVHTIKALFADGSSTSTSLTISARPKIEAPLGIPDKLGGNTPEAASQLLTNLAKENIVLNTVQSSSTLLWNETFGYPLENIFVTDDYGYDRLTVNSTIVHKGTDFRAPEGTPVFAMNDGVVKVARTFIVYGNSVIIDHGLGVQTLYMHLSKLNVKEGDVVSKGDLIGQSGMTGYAEQPHLHISIKINSVSIDPMTFMGFFR